MSPSERAPQKGSYTRLPNEKGNPHFEVGHQVRVEPVRMTPGFVQRRPGVNQGLGIVFFGLVKLSQPVVRIQFIGEGFAQTLTEPLGFVPLPLPDEVIHAVGERIEIGFDDPRPLGGGWPHGVFRLAPAALLVFLSASAWARVIAGYRIHGFHRFLMRAALTSFVPDTDALEKLLRRLKHIACPFCEKTGTLNRHSRLWGNDPLSANGTLDRGQRVFCSNRGRRGGCGRTSSIFFAQVLPRHTFTASLLWKALSGWLAGASIKASWEAAGLPLALDTLYHLLQRLRRRLNELRTALHSLGAPPGSKASDPLRQTFEHLRGVFAADSCPPERFHLRLQRSLLG